MTKFFAPRCAFAIAGSLIGLSLFALQTQPAHAQGFNIGGIKVQNGNQSNNNNDDDDDDDSNHQGKQRSNKKSSNNSNGQIQQFFPGSQFGQGQNNQGGSIQSGRSTGQGKNSNKGQFQNWQQNNQNGLSIGSWNSGKWQGSHDAKKWTQAFGGNQQPFSNQWYKDHPKAWKYNNQNSNVSVWVGGTLPGVYSWLGWGNVPQQYQGNWGQQHFDHAHYGQWYPLGVYSLMTSPGDPGTRIVQLAVDQHGHLGGNYYDMITGSNYSLTGDIRQQSQQVTWWLNKNQFVRFRAHVSQLLQPYGMVTVQLPGGEQQWQFVRLEN